MDSPATQLPFYGEGFVRYPYAPPYGYYPLHPSAAYASSPAGAPPFPYPGYVPTFYASTSRRRRQRSRSADSKSTRSTRSREDADKRVCERIAGDVPIKEIDPIPVRAVSAPEEVVGVTGPPEHGTHAATTPAITVNSVRTGTTPIIAPEPVATAAAASMGARSEPEEPPLSQMFRVTPARDIRPNTVPAYPFLLLYLLFFFPCAITSSMISRFAANTNPDMHARILQVFLPMWSRKNPTRARSKLHVSQTARKAALVVDETAILPGDLKWIVHFV